MELTIILFLFGGLFLGWSLGANDAANVFGTAVGTRMISFKTAALVCSIFVVLGDAGTIKTSSNGVNWISRSSGTSNDLKAITSSE